MVKEVGIGIGLALILFAAFQGINVLPFLLFGSLVGLFYYLTRSTLGYKNYEVLKTHKGNKRIKFEDIGGQDTAKKELLEALDFIKNEKMVIELGIRPIKGILLSGPPGTGKTLLAKAAANYIDSVFVSASGSEFIEMYAGVGAQRIRQLFDNAKKMAQKKNKDNAVIFIDEIDVLASKRGKTSSHLEYDQTLNQLLVEMDGIKVDEDVRILIIAATNRMDALDRAILRPGRFDRIVQVDLPDKEGRKRILEIHTQNKPLADDVKLDKLARETYGFSGAHLESLANEAAIMAMRENKKKIHQKHFDEAIEKVMMGEKLDRRPGEKEMERIAVHETGHALISEALNPGSVSAITTTSRGNALGYIRQLPQKDLYLYTRDYLENQIATALGGANAEDIILGSKSTGSSNDFQQAVKLSKKIILSGLSNLGVVDEENLTPRLMHTAINQIIKKQEKKVRGIITKYRKVIDYTVKVLMDKEKISGDEFRKIIREEKPLKISN